MNEENAKPIIFLAYANDRNDLRNLPEEARRIRKVLAKAEGKGLCKYVERPNATLKDILDVFQNSDWRNRIAVFHYAGHANGYELLLESASGETAIADGRGLAAFLGQQTGLRLVFLNACATQPQVQGLLDAQVPVVIATSSIVGDEAAMIFASRFYRGLAGGASIRTAYKEAEADLLSTTGAGPRNLYAGANGSSDRWCWDLYPREGATAAKEWNLPEAVANPLFGLPCVPVSDLPSSPYPGPLKPFECEHAEIFFGRGYQIRELYCAVTATDANPIILFYGQSGVGKSSVLAAGLIPRLETGYSVRYLRRDAKGLIDNLKDALLSEGWGKDLLGAWLAREQELGKPLVIILDQVEEVFTSIPSMNGPNELPNFLDELKSVFKDPNRRPRGKLILGFRKEWLAEIRKQIEVLNLPISGVFLGRLDLRGVIEAVVGPERSLRLRNHYKLKVEKNLPEVIAHDLLRDPESHIAPTLQILLTNMWKNAVAPNSNQRVFNQDLYEKVRGEGDVLQAFLNQQLAELKHQDAVTSGLALDVLAAHVTDMVTAGTKTAVDLEKEYNSKAEAVSDLVDECKNLYLLTDPAKQLESPRASRLAHDTLAPLVRRMFDQSDKPGQRARRILENRSFDWQDGKDGNPLDERDLKAVEEGARGMREWTTAEKRMVEASRNARRKRIRAQQKVKIFQRGAIVTVTIVAVIAVLQWIKADKNARIAFSRQLAAQALSFLDRELDLALLLSVESLHLRETIEARESLLRTLNHAPRLNTFLVGHAGAVDTLAFLPESKILVSGGSDGKIILWDMSDPRSAKQIGSPLAHPGPVFSLGFIPESNVLASGGRDGKIPLWDIFDPRSAQQIGSPLAHPAGVSSLAFIPESKILATGDSDGKIKLWDMSEPRSAKQIGSLLAHSVTVYSLAFIPESKILASGGRDGKITLWDISEPRSAKQIGSLLAHPRPILSLVFIPESKVLVSWGMDGGIVLWDISEPRSAKQIGSPLAHSEGVSSLAFIPETKILAVGSRQGKIALWDISDLRLAKQIESLPAHPDRDVSSLAFIPESKVLVSGGTDGKIMLWDMSDPRSAKQIGSLAHPKRQSLGITKGVSSLAFIPESKILVSGGTDGKLILWDLSDPRSAKEIGSLAHPVIVRSLAFIPESKVLASIGGGKIMLWDMDWSSMQARACQMANREFNADEWKLYLEPYYGENTYRGICKDLLKKFEKTKKLLG